MAKKVITLILAGYLFSGTLRLAGAEGSTLQVISADGVVIHTQKLISSDKIIRLEHLRIGVY